MDRPITAIIDACVLYSAPVRDLVIRLAQADLVRARWTTDIHDEWMRNILNNNPHISRTRLERTKLLMDEAVRDCVVTGHEGLIDSLIVPDPDDRHVLAAAIQGGAEVIVTFNLVDFPPDQLARYHIEALHPDEFFSNLFDSAVDDFCMAVNQQRQGLKNPPKSVEEFLATVEAVGLPQTAARLRDCADRI
jgi:predicted nucleic acid-binding protein